MPEVGLVGSSETDARTLSRNTSALIVHSIPGRVIISVKGHAVRRSDSLLLGPGMDQLLALSSALNSWSY